MTMLTANPPVLPRLSLRRPFRDEPVFMGAALVLTLSMIPVLLAMALDTRVFQMESPWIKPFKFQMALALYLATLAIYARWLPETVRSARWYKIFAWVVVGSVVGEMVWIGGAAAFATASHFNTSSAAMAAIYNLMGALAVTLTSASTVYGVAIWRNANTGLSHGMRAGLSLGLVLTLPLTLITAGFMSGYGSHFVGTPLTHATLPILGWSTEVGDLRVSHFFATHALHLIPLAVWCVGGSTRMAWGAASVFAIFTLATFGQALMGLPVLAL